MPDALRLARAVRELLATPDRWTQGAAARDSRGVACDWADETAVVSWCILGAIYHFGAPTSSVLLLRRALSRQLGEMDTFLPVDSWNDTPGRTHADVLELLDRVVAEMEAA